MSVAKTVIIDESGKYLILTRSDHPRFHFDPDLPGGAVEEGEEPIDANVRELHEELGILISASDLEHLYSGTDYSAHGTEYHLYTLQLQDRPEIAISWEHSASEWVDKEAFVSRAESAVDTYMHMVSDVLKKLENKI